MNLTLKIFLIAFLLIITIILINTLKRKNISMLKTIMTQKFLSNIVRI